MYVGDGGEWKAIGDSGVYPRIVNNLLPESYRFLDGVLGTFTAPGTKTQTITETEYGVPNSSILLESNAAGRAFLGPASAHFNLVAGQWYAFSFDLLEKTEVLNSNCGLSRVSGAIIDRGSFGITHTQLNAGGIGRYACVFMSVQGGTMLTRLGVGLSVGTTGMMMRVANLQLEKIDISVSRAPSEYVYPRHSAVFPYANGLTIDANGKVSASAAAQPKNTKPYSNILVVGDSRSDEITDIGGALDVVMQSAGVGIANCHAEGGWTTSNIIGPVNNAGATYNKTVSLETAIAGTIARRSWPSPAAFELWDYRYPGALPFDTLLIANAGYNDINQAATPAAGLETAYANFITIIQTAERFGLNVVVTDNNPFSAHGTYTTDKRDALIALGDRLRQYCAENGHIYISIYDLLGDSTDQHKLSDGAGTTPNYSADALHLNSAGATAVATLINNTLNNYRF